MTTNKMRAIRYFSMTNEWIDFLVFVPSEYTDAAIKTISDAMNDYWDGDYEHHGYAVSHSLEFDGIPFTMIHLPWDYKLDKPAIPERVWEEWIDGLPECVTLNQLWEVR